MAPSWIDTITATIACAGGGATLGQSFGLTGAGVGALVGALVPLLARLRPSHPVRSA